MTQRLSPSIAATFVGYHFALFVAAASWLLAAMFVGLILDMSNLPRGALLPMTAAVGPALGGLAAWRLARRLRRTSTVYWLPMTAGYAAAPIAGAIGLLFVLGWALRSYELRGPTSSAGLQPVIAVRDAGLGIGADFYCDLRVLDATGAVIAERQCGSQHPRGGPQLLRDSMQWTSPTTLAFTTRSGAEQLNVR